MILVLEGCQSFILHNRAWKHSRCLGQLGVVVDSRDSLWLDSAVTSKALLVDRRRELSKRTRAEQQSGDKDFGMHDDLWYAARVSCGIKMR